MARGDHAGAALATGSGIAARMAERTIRNASRLLMRNHVDLTVTGLDHVPATGPVVIAARHFHHLYDGTAILTSVPRTVRILVALDWVTAGAQRRLAEGLCTMAGWPVVLRPPRAGADGVRVNPDGAGSADRHEPERYLWRAFRQSARWLGDGGALLIFPEAYPNIDPSFTPKTADPDEMLPLLPGAVRIPLMAQRLIGQPIPVVPAGLHYAPSGDDDWRVYLRFGEPLTVADDETPDATLARLADAIQGLSRTEAMDHDSGPNGTAPRPSTTPATRESRR